MVDGWKESLVNGNFDPESEVVIRGGGDRRWWAMI